MSLLDRISDDLVVLERTMPSNDATMLVRAIRGSLSKAIEDASHVDTFVSIEQLHDLTGRPESTLRRLCQRYGNAIGARKITGSWTIHWSTFEKAWKSGTLEMESAA